MEFNLETIITSVITGILSITAVSAFLIRYLGKASKYANIAKEAVEALTAVVNSLKDGKLSTEEIEAIKKEIEEFKLAIKG